GQVFRLATGRWACLHEPFYAQPVRSEEVNPDSVRRMELHRLHASELETMLPEVRSDQSTGLPVGREVERHIAERTRGREDEPPALPKQPGGLRHRSFRVGERHRSPVAEDQVERRVPEREALRAPSHQRESEPGLSLQLPRARELGRRKVEAGRSSAATGERDRPPGRAASQLENRLPPGGPQKTKLALGDPEQAPRRGRRSPQDTREATVVPRTDPVPDHPVVADVSDRARTTRPPANSSRPARHPERPTGTLDDAR